MPNKKINQLTPRTPTLTDLILVGDPTTGYSYKATLSAMINFVGGNIQFSSLGGISLTNPTNGQYLTFNGTNWVNQTPASAPVSSVFGRTGAVVAAEGDYSLTQLSDVTISSPTNGQVLKYNGTAWVNGSDTDTGIISLNGLTATTQTFATGTSGTDFNISSTTSTHTFNLPTASATNRGALSSSDWTTFNAKQNAITLATIGNSGAATFISNTLNIPNYTLAGLGGITLNSLAASSPLSYDSITGIFSIQIANSTQNGYLSSLSFNTFTNKQNAITLTTIGSSGSATFISDTLNIPTYTLAGLGGISLSSLSASAPLSYNSGTGAFSITQASGSTNGFLSSTDWTTFNNKQSTITLTTTGSSGASTFVSNTLNIPNYTLAGLGGVSGSGTTNYVSKWTGSTALGNSQIFDNGTSVGIGTATPSASYLLDVNGISRLNGNVSIGNFTLPSSLLSNTTWVRFGRTGMIYATNTGTDIAFQNNLYHDGSNIYRLVTGFFTDIYFDQNGNIDFRNAGSAAANTVISASTRMRITNAGRLLLGTTTESTFLLDVNGTARIQGATTISTGRLTISNAGNDFYPLYIGSSSVSNSRIYLESSGLQDIVASGGPSLRFQSGSLRIDGTNNTTNKVFISTANGVSQHVVFWLNAGETEIGGTGGVLPTSAMLSVTSTTKGFLPPRMTTTQKNAISSPAAGLVVYDTTLKKLCVYTTAWETITSL